MKERKIEINGLISLCLYIAIMFGFRFIIKYLPLDSLGYNENELTSFINLILYLVLFISIIIINSKIFKPQWEETKKNGFLVFFAYCILGYFILLFFSSIGSSITLLLGGTGSSENQEAIKDSLLLPNAWMMVVSAVILGPFVEEMIFRKSIFSIFEKANINKYIALAFSSILFGLIHVISGGDFVEIFPYLFMGLGFGLIYIYTKNIYITLFIHMMQNLISILIIIYVLPFIENIQGSF